MEKIEIGIWNVYSNGITCNQPELTTGCISVSDIYATIRISKELVWDIPIHIARKTWATKKDTEDLLTAMAIHRLQYPLLHPVAEDINNLDRRTDWYAGAIINHRNNSGEAA